MDIKEVSPVINSTYVAPVTKNQENTERSSEKSDIAVVYKKSNDNEVVIGLYTPAATTYSTKAPTTYVDKVAKALSLDSTEKATFKKVWNYLRTDMKLTKKQAAGVCDKRWCRI